MRGEEEAGGGEEEEVGRVGMWRQEEGRKRR